MYYQIPEDKQSSSKVSSLLVKLIAGIFVLICLAIGVVG